MTDKPTGPLTAEQPMFTPESIRGLIESFIFRAGERKSQFWQMLADNLNTYVLGMQALHGDKLLASRQSDRPATEQTPADWSQDRVDGYHDGWGACETAAAVLPPDGLRELLQEILNCDTLHDERGHAYLKVPARSVFDLGGRIADALARATPAPDHSDKNYCPECSAFLPSEPHKPMCRLTTLSAIRVGRAAAPETPVDGGLLADCREPDCCLQYAHPGLHYNAVRGAWPSAAKPNECTHTPITNEAEEGMSRIRWALAKSYNDAVQVFADICQQRIAAAEAAAMERAARICDDNSDTEFAAEMIRKSIFPEGQSALEAERAKARLEEHRRATGEDDDHKCERCKELERQAAGEGGRTT